MASYQLFFGNPSTSNIIESDALSSGLATATGVSGSRNVTVADSSGLATATGIAASINLAVGAASGAATATASAQTIVGVVGASIGIAEGFGFNSAFSLSTGNSSGLATATGQAEDASIGSVGVSNGLSNALGISSAIAGVIASSSGTSTAQADAENTGTSQDVTGAGGDDAPRGIYYQDQKRRKIGRKPLDKLLDKAIVEYRQELKGFAKSEREEVKAIVAPFVEDGVVDYPSLQVDIDAIRALMVEYQRFLVRRDEEEILILMMMG